MMQMEKRSIQFQKLICTGSPKYIGGTGWYILGEPAEYDGTNDDALTPFVINTECLIPLIEMEDQPPLKNIKKVQNTKETLDTDNSPNSV